MGATGPGLFSPWFGTPDQQGRIDHAEPFAYLSLGRLKSWRLCGIALALSLERKCLHATRPGQIWDLRPKGRSLISRSWIIAGESPAIAQKSGPAVLKARRVSEGRGSHGILQDRCDRFDLIRFVRGLGSRIGGRSDVIDQDTEDVRTDTAYRDCGSMQSKLYRVERSAPETSVEGMRHRQRTLSLVKHVSVAMHR